MKKVEENTTDATAMRAVLRGVYGHFPTETRNMQDVEQLLQWIVMAGVM
jgi:hypothetical protein